jgi:uncharacterized protein
MDERTAAETVVFIRRIASETSTKELSIIFHGGEPLLAPLMVWRVLLNGIRAQLADYTVKLSLQSNLWNLSDEYLALLRDHDVSIGTSLDGPKELCDLNRGEGYFVKTHASVQKANAAGCSVSAIATITKRTLPHTREIARYFRDRGIPLVLHGALGGMNDKNSSFALTAKEYAGMLKDLYPWYVENRKHMQIDTLDYFVRGVVCGSPGVCTLRDCSGMFLAVSPTGDITSCQRLAGREEYSLGSVFDRPSLAELYESSAAKRQRQRQQQVAERCASCEFYPICKGGCYYNALTSEDGVIDPWCEAYKDVYTFLQRKVTDEMKRPENIEAVSAAPATPDEHPLLRRGAYISLSGNVHPARIADNARRVLAIHELGRTGDPHVAAENLCGQQICGEAALTEKLLENMRQGLEHNHKSRNNCYVHVTFNCNLRCGHCYAEGGDNSSEADMTCFERLVQEASAERFRQLVITGGEPLVHSQRTRLFDICEAHRGKGMNLVLRTNLTGVFDEAEMAALARSFDQVVVSVDGSAQTHDARRGAGSYENMTRNLERYVSSAASIPNAAELSLACVMGADDINGEPGRSVRALGERLGVRRIRFRPLLPLGRASHLEEPVMCEGLAQHVSPEDMLKSTFRPLTTCGIGQNLFVRPDGGAYPCYAWCGEHTLIGNVFTGGLAAVLASPGFARLVDCSVDTIKKCRECEYRYLCGGACRAWGNQTVLDVNAAPPQCDHLRQRAQKLADAARKYVLDPASL